MPINTTDKKYIINQLFISIDDSLLRKKKEEGVKIRIVTRGPANQGPLKETATLALRSLIKLKIIVDLRKDIHHKNVFIDDDIVWSGSLNVLSYGGKSTQAETFIRLPKSKATATRAARYAIYKSQNTENENAIDILTKRENRDCEKCGKLFVSLPIMKNHIKSAFFFVLKNYTVDS